MRATGWLIVSALLLGALTGCGDASPAARPSAPGPGSPVAGPGSVSAGPAGGPASPAPGPSTGPGSPGPVAGVLVEYGRQGGIAGVDERLAIQADGSYSVSRHKGDATRGALTPGELARLKQVFADARFDRVPTVNPGPAGTADGFTYFVAYGNRRVLAEDGGVPPALSPVLDALQAVMSR
jgi:hypothetical protein